MGEVAAYNAGHEPAVIAKGKVKLAEKDIFMEFEEDGETEMDCSVYDEVPDEEESDEDQ